MVIPTDIKIKYTKLFINNEFVDSVDKKTFPTLNPSTGQKIADIAEGNSADVDIAVNAAKQAFHRNSEWRKISPSQRGILINKLADLFEKNVDELAKLESLNNGKALTNARGDVLASVNVFRYYAGLADKVSGQTLPINDFFSITKKEPIGVVGQIIPWNYPLFMMSFKWAPALAAGCTIVLKPAEQTPLSALYAAALSKEAGFPKGVINVITGYGPTAGAPIALHKDIAKVSFTGSTEIGRKILRYAAESNLKKVTLELGGKSPLIVLEDADVDKAALIAHEACFENHGQCCCAGTRTFVHASIYDKFVKKATELAKSRKVGDPFESATRQGPQIDQPSIEKIVDLVESGIKQGAKLQTGGKRIGDQGYFYEPTVFSDVKDDMRIAKEEIFGPVQSIFKFNTIDEVIDRANDTEYGLAGGVVTNNLENALFISNNLRSGSVWINCYNVVLPQTPFGGYKMSGIGREMGTESIEAYLETKTITIKPSF